MNEWTKNTPTQEGYYWYWDTTRYPTVRCKEVLRNDKGELYTEWSLGEFRLNWYRGYWLGPIEPPAPPKEDATRNTP